MTSFEVVLGVQRVCVRVILMVAKKIGKVVNLLLRVRKEGKSPCNSVDYIPLCRYLAAWVH